MIASNALQSTGKLCSAKVANILGYQSLKIGASSHEGKCLTNDHRFCLKVSASHIDQWSTKDVTL